MNDYSDACRRRSPARMLCPCCAVCRRRHVSTPAFAAQDNIAISRSPVTRGACGTGRRGADGGRAAGGAPPAPPRGAAAAPAGRAGAHHCENPYAARASLKLCREHWGIAVQPSRTLRLSTGRSIAPMLSVQSRRRAGHHAKNAEAWPLAELLAVRPGAVSHRRPIIDFGGRWAS